MIEGKGLGGKRINRVNVSLANKEVGDLRKLATACRMKPTELAWHLIRRCLYDEVIFNEFQDEYAIHNAYRVVFVRNHETGEVIYTLNERC